MVGVKLGTSGMLKNKLIAILLLVFSVACHADDIIQQRIEASPNDVVVLVMPNLKAEANVRWLVVTPEYLTWKQMLTPALEPACVFGMGNLKSAKVYGDAVEIVDGKILRTTIQFNVVPTGPVPIPDPIDPDPVDPDPIDPTPVPTALRVLIMEETADRGKLPRPQYNALMSPKVRSYLMAKTLKGPDGKTPEWRQWDDDLSPIDLVHVGEYWQKAHIRAKTASKGVLPWIDINSGAGSFPLPATEDEYISALKRFGGE